jgi:uncharacterized cupin superfamily protein
VGWHTGKHKHGEEALHIVEGSGFSIVNGVRYDWAKCSTMVLPFGSEHQHFNTGPVPARYFSVLSVHLEHFVGVHRTVQFEHCGPTTASPDAPASADGLDERGRRIVLRLEQAPVHLGGEGGKPPPTIEPGKPLVLGTREGMKRMGGAHMAKRTELMRWGTQTNGFQIQEQEISDILTDSPHSYGGTHAHMEAILYILDGTGHSIIDGEEVPWKKGSCLQVPGPQTVHQHINDGDVESQMLRVAAGVRYFFEPAAREEFPFLYFAIGKAAEQRERQRERVREG